MQEQNNTIDINDLARIRWACRRGMLELDVILGKFLASAYASNAPEDKQKFVTLLNYADPLLFSWLLGHEIPEDPAMQSIVQMIRNHARSRI